MRWCWKHPFIRFAFIYFRSECVCRSIHDFRSSCILHGEIQLFAMGIGQIRKKFSNVFVVFFSLLCFPFVFVMLVVLCCHCAALFPFVQPKYLRPTLRNIDVRTNILSTNAFRRYNKCVALCKWNGCGKHTHWQYETMHTKQMYSIPKLDRTTGNWLCLLQCTAFYWSFYLEYFWMHCHLAIESICMRCARCWLLHENQEFSCFPL